MDAWFEVEWRESGRNGRWEAEVEPRPEWLRSPLHYRNGVSEGGRLSLMTNRAVELEMITVNGVSVIVDGYGKHPAYRWWRGRVDRVQNDDLLGLSFRSHAPVFLPDVDGCRVELDLAWRAEDRAELGGAAGGRAVAELGRLPRAGELSAWLVGADRVRMRWANPYTACRDWPTRRWLAWEIELRSDDQLHSERMLWCDAVGRGATCRHEIALPSVLPYADVGGMSVARDGWGVLAYRVRLAEAGAFAEWSDWEYVDGGD